MFSVVLLTVFSTVHIHFKRDFQFKKDQRHEETGNQEEQTNPSDNLIKEGAVYYLGEPPLIFPGFSHSMVLRERRGMGSLT